MGVLNFIVDASQDGRLAALEEKVETLQEQIEVISKWVSQLKAEIESVKKFRDSAEVVDNKE